MNEHRLPFANFCKHNIILQSFAKLDLRKPSLQIFANSALSSQKFANNFKFHIYFEVR